jgi:hypothetical protein
MNSKQRESAAKYLYDVSISKGALAALAIGSPLFKAGPLDAAYYLLIAVLSFVVAYQLESKA